MSDSQKLSIGRRAAALLLSGISIGLLLGLSVSPMLHLVVGAITALTASIVGSLAGLQATPDEPQTPRRLVRPIDPIPFALLVVGLALGSPLGIYLRTNDVFGPRPSVVAGRWSGTGLEARQIQIRLLDHLYPCLSRDCAPAGAPVPGAPASSSRLVAGLYAMAAEDCELLALKKGEGLRARLLLLGDTRMTSAVETCRDDNCLVALRTSLCGKSE